MMLKPERADHVDWNRYFSDKRKTAELGSVELQIDAQQTDSYGVISLGGKLRAETKDQLVDIVHGQEWNTPVIVDLRNLRQLNIDGLVGIFLLFRNLHRAGQKLIIVADNDHDVALLHSSSLSDMATVVPDFDKALHFINKPTESSHE